jgi:hypothetical protein
MARDPFDLEAGGFTTDYTATTTMVVFANGQFNFQATFTNRYDTPVTKDDGTLSLERPEFVTIGSNDEWQPLQEGAAFGHVSKDPDRRVRSNSGYGRLIERVLELVGRDALIEQGRTDPYCSAFWEGLHFHWETEGEGKDYSFKDKDTGETKSGKTKGYTIPTEYLGAANGAVVEDFDPTSLGLPETVLGQLVTIAAESASPGEFQGKALQVALTQEDPTHKQAMTAALAESRLWAALRA